MDVVTGAAGFIGSHLSARLLAEGRDVVGVDSLTDYYDPGRKVDNLGTLLDHPRFRLEVVDLATTEIDHLLRGAARVFHLAGQPGVRPSWGPSFEDYVQRNVLATQVLLESCATARVKRVVYASSSSVYGDAAVLPTHEGVLPRPRSPYGVTKLAAEHLCDAYAASCGLSIASLRLFTVYGPRQRPDMAFARLVEAAVHHGPFTLNDDGLQIRDFTYVDDVVDAFLAAGDVSWEGTANIGGGSPVAMIDAIRLVTELCGPLPLRQAPPQNGDVRRTSADTTLARDVLGWRPTVSLEEGLARMVSSVRRHVAVPT